MAVDPTGELTRVLVRALRALGQAGQPVQASRLAAAGWAALRHQRPTDAERLNGLLHYLARLPGHADAPSDSRQDVATPATNTSDRQQPAAGD